MSVIVKRVLAAAVILVSAVGVSLYAAEVQATKPGIAAITKDGNWDAALRRCTALGGDSYASEAGVCIYDVLLKAAKDNKMMKASEAVTRYADEDINFYGLCHKVVHVLGEELFRYYGSIDLAVEKVNGKDCGTGLSHGVIDYWTMQNPTYDEFVSAAAACETAMSIRFGGCAEGIGHATYQYQEPGTTGRQENAFKLCGIFKNEENQEFCAYGAMMQPYIKQNPSILEKAIPVPEWKSHLSICKTLDVPKGVQRGCYSGGGWIMGVDLANRLAPGGVMVLTEKQYDAVSAEATRGVQVCNSDVVLDEFQFRCTQEYLARMPLDWYRDIERLEQSCTALRKEQGNIAGDLCLSGAHEFTPTKEMKILLEKYPQIRKILGVKLKDSLK